MYHPGERDWLMKVQTALWETLEGAYIDFETLPDSLIVRYLRLQQYAIEKVVEIIIRHNRLTMRLQQSKTRSAL